MTTVRTCDPAAAMTRSLLGYGVIAGPLYVAVALGQAVTRDGFDLRRHQWSLLANGEHGWIQVANFVLTGLMIVAAAVGLRRAFGLRATVGLRRGVDGGAWAARLIGVFGVSMVAAGVFRADPALGFPVGSPDGPSAVSWHGMAHFMAGGIGFTALAVACFLVARRYSADGRTGWARFSLVAGAVFLAGFAMVASGQGSTAANLGFTAAVLLVLAWLSAVSAQRYCALSS